MLSGILRSEAVAAVLVDRADERRHAGDGLGDFARPVVGELADERPQYVSREKTVRGYDDNFIGLVIVSLFMLAVTGFALAAVLCYHVCAPIEAPVIKKGLMGNRQGLFDTHGRCIQAQPTFAP